VMQYAHQAMYGQLAARSFDTDCAYMFADQRSVLSTDAAVAVWNGRIRIENFIQFETPVTLRAAIRTAVESKLELIV
jgi:hypothetical protein